MSSRSHLIVMSVLGAVVAASVGVACQPAPAPPPGPLATIDHLGIFTPRVTNGVRVTPAQMVAEAKALHVDTIRLEQDITAPLASGYDTYAAAGLKVVLTIRNDPQLGDQGKPTVEPPHTAAQLAAFRANLDHVLDQVHPVMVAVENEEVGSPFVTGTAAEYEAELEAAVAVGHAHGVPVINGGITAHTVALLTWQDLHDRGLIDQADTFARQTFTFPRDRQTLADLLARPYAGLHNTKVAAQLAEGKELVAAYRTSPMDDVNFHWYFDSDASLRTSVAYLRRATGHDVVTHEIGQYTKDPAVVTGHLRTLAELHVPLVMWFDADGDPAVGLHDQPGVLRPTGAAFAATAPTVAT